MQGWRTAFSRQAPCPAETSVQKEEGYLEITELQDEAKREGR